jgi:hypothetical protein
MANKLQGCAGWAVAGILGLIAIGQCVGKDPPTPDGAFPLALTDASEPAAVPERAREYLYVRTDSLNCRASPSTGSARVARIENRKLVGIVREENGWAKLADPDCWVWRDFLGNEPLEQARPQALYGNRASEESPRRSSRSAYYRNCSAARAAGAAPVYSGDPGYARHLDRDGDGVGCE